MSEPAPLYLDHAATTPLDPRVLEEMLPYLEGEYGNAASRHHALGRRAAQAVERARERVAELIGADPREIVFTSGATEANNLALKGVAGAPAHAAAPRHVVTGATEHHAVLDPLARLVAEGAGTWRVTRLAVDGAGRVALDDLERALDGGALLVSLMAANNEVGTLHPLGAIGAACRARGVLFHTDATQAVGKEPIDVDALGIDLLSLSAHKFHGPKGVGALYLRRRRPRVRCRALLDGGGHERDLRSGTLNVPGIVGLGRAAELAAAEMDAERRRVAGLRDALERALLEGLPGVHPNGPREGRLAGITNLSFDGVDAESLLARFTRVAASSSSACTSARRQPSHVLRALGLGEERIGSSVRFSLGRGTTPDDVREAVEEIRRAVEAERTEGPRARCAPGDPARR